MAERKVSKPRVVRMWAVRYSWRKTIDNATRDRRASEFTAFINGGEVVEVEVREVKARKSGKGKVKRGR